MQRKDVMYTISLSEAGGTKGEEQAYVLIQYETVQAYYNFKNEAKELLLHKECKLIFLDEIKSVRINVYDWDKVTKHATTGCFLKREGKDYEYGISCRSKQECNTLLSILELTDVDSKLVGRNTEKGDIFFYTKEYEHYANNIGRGATETKGTEQLTVHQENAGPVRDIAHNLPAMTPVMATTCISERIPCNLRVENKCLAFCFAAASLPEHFLNLFHVGYERKNDSMARRISDSTSVRIILPAKSDVKSESLGFCKLKIQNIPCIQVVFTSALAAETFAKCVVTANGGQDDRISLNMDPRIVNFKRFSDVKFLIHVDCSRAL